MTPRIRTSPFRRGLSSLLALLYLAVAIGGAVRHAGEHDETGLEWLPSEYHHHHFEIVQEGAEAHPGFDLCVACHWSRLGPRHVGERSSGVEAAPVLRIAADGSEPGVRDGAALLPDSRGPPFA